MSQVDIFDIQLQEQVWRQQFFYNAFRALAFNGITGDYAEFGCWGGMTFAMAYGESRRQKHRAHLWAFDSFQGLPPTEGPRDEHPIWQAGTLKTSLDEFHGLCAQRGVPRADYSVVPGFYQETLDHMAADAAPRDIALAYVDCDLYSSTRSVLAFLMPRLKHGMLIAFDDYFCWTATQISGERRAMEEALGDHPRWQLVPYVQFGWHGQSFVVEDRQISGR